MLHFETEAGAAARRSRRRLRVASLVWIAVFSIGISYPSRSSGLNSYESVVSGKSVPPKPSLAQAETDAARSDGPWRLIRTPGPPDRGGEIVSIIRTADALASDPDFAGMVIRCREGTALQVAFVVVTPFPPKARPRITVDAKGAPTQFESAVIPPGSMLSLPDEAIALVRGPWASAGKLNVDIANGDSRIKGIVSLDGLPKALGELRSNCPAR